MKPPFVFATGNDPGIEPKTPVGVVAEATTTHCVAQAWNAGKAPSSQDFRAFTFL